MKLLHSRFTRLLSVLLLVSLAAAWPATAPVQADVGPQPVLPGGGSISPGGDTPIVMAAEVVTMTVRAATAADNTLVDLTSKAYSLDSRLVWYPGVAEVQADFTMRNPTADPVSLTVWFPLASALRKVSWDLRPWEMVPRLVNFEVSLNGSPLEHTVSDLPNPQGTDKPDLPWASFLVTFPAGVETLIQVRYQAPLSPSPKGNEMALYYVFETGAGWAGKIGRADLILNLPYPASEGTITGRSSGNLSLPYLSVQKQTASLPAGVVIQGKQVRWTWRDFEPGPEDEFAVLLLQPDDWTALQEARAAVQARPQDGQAWLDLALTNFNLSYYTLSFRQYVFGASYAPAALAAFHQAAELLPEHPAPQAGLALMDLIPYLSTKDVPPQLMAEIQKESQRAKDLAALYPQLAEEEDTRWLLSALEEALWEYNHNDATATVEAATWQVYKITQTAQATLEYATRIIGQSAKATWVACYATAGPNCTVQPSPTRTDTPAPSRSATPVPSVITRLPTANATLPTAAGNSGQTQGQALLLAAGAAVLLTVGYFVLRRGRIKRN